MKNLKILTINKMVKLNKSQEMAHMMVHKMVLRMEIWMDLSNKKSRQKFLINQMDSKINLIDLDLNIKISHPLNQILLIAEKNAKRMKNVSVIHILDQHLLKTTYQVALWKTAFQIKLKIHAAFLKLLDSTQIKLVHVNLFYFIYYFFFNKKKL